MLVNLYTMNKCLVLRMEIDSPGKRFLSDFMRQEIEAFHGSLDIEADRDTDTEYVSLSFLTGGERE